MLVFSLKFITNYDYVAATEFTGQLICSR